MFFLKDCHFLEQVTVILQVPHGIGQVQMEN